MICTEGIARDLKTVRGADQSLKIAGARLNIPQYRRG